MKSPISTSYLFFIYLFSWSVLRVFYLDFAFYWDEAWVYAPALRVMSELGPSIMPDAIPEFYSRGHPLLFHFLGGIWLKIFGTSYISFHSYALSISILFLLATYTTLKEWSNEKVALISVILLSFNKTFFAEASTVQPEVMVALFTILSLRYFILNNNVLYILFTSLLLLTKESGIILPFAIATYHLANVTLIRKSNDYKAIAKQLVIILLPLLTFGVFLLTTYFYKGWFLFPEHTNMIVLEARYSIDRIKELFKLICDADNRFWITGIMAIGILISKKNKIESLLALIGGILGIYLIVYESKTAQFIELLGLILLVVSLYSIYKFYIKETIIHQHNILLILVLFTVMYMLFTVMNFYTVRYLITIFPFLYFFAVLLLHETFGSNRNLYFIVLIFILVKTIPLNFNGKIPNSLANQNDYITVRNKLVQDLENRAIFNEKIAVPDYVIARILQDKNIGFLHSDKVFTNLDWNIETSRFTIINNYDQYPEILKSDKFKLLVKFEKGINWIEVWEKMP